MRRRPELNPRLGRTVHCSMRRSAGVAAIGLAMLSPAVVRAQAVAPFSAPEAEEPAQPPPGAREPAAPAPGVGVPDTWGGAPTPSPRRELEPPDPLPLPPPSSDPGALELGSAPTEPHVRYTLEAIDVRGSKRTRSRVVMRYVPFKPGDVIDVDDPEVELTRYRLLGTGFFRDVQFSLRKGSARGRVVLVIDVEERNTIIVNDIWMGVGADADTRGKKRPLTPYAGLAAAETNLAGTGITLGGAMGIANEQLALRVRFLDPAFLGGRWMASTQLLFNDAKDFFGNSDVAWDDTNQLEDLPDYAVVRYKRFGGSLGVGRDLAVPTQFWTHYRLESVDATLPRAASHVRGLDREPIIFDILPGRSVLSTLKGSLQHDTRDHPFLPTRGWYAVVDGEVGLGPLGSDYAYQKVDVSISRWWELPWKKHVLRLDLFGGSIAGDAPFFEQYYVGDFSDFLPARVLGMNFDRRPPPNFLDTAIVEVRYGHYAFKLGSEYRVPLYRGQRSVYGIDFFGSAGIYGLANRRDLEHPPRGYSRLQLIPIDLTGNLGFRMDTAAGGFAFAFSNVIGFIPVRNEGGP